MLIKLNDEILFEISAGSAKQRWQYFKEGFVLPIVFPSFLVAPLDSTFLKITAAVLVSPLTIPTGLVVGTIRAIKNNGFLL